jgi:DNA repair exonuclease SbcCD ATPase subunit
LNRLRRQVLQERLDNLAEEYIMANRQLHRSLDDTQKLRIRRNIKDLEQRIRKVEAELAEIPDVNQAAPVTTGESAVSTSPPGLMGVFWVVLFIAAIINWRSAADRWEIGRTSCYR